MTNEQSKILWNIETDRLHEIAFDLLIKRTEEINNRLFLKGEDKRCAYTPLSDFIKSKYMLDNYIPKAKIIIRTEKINKIINER